MPTISVPLRAALVSAALGFLLAGCGINAIPTQEERAKAAWSEVLNQYQRRADLIPNLVETVRGFAQQERDVLTSVVEARARATQIRVDASTITDPEAFKRFQEDLVIFTSSRYLSVAGQAVGHDK